MSLFSLNVHSHPHQFIKMVLELIILLFLILITNFNFTIFHLYMRKNPEFSNRLLNVLYSFHAILLQFESLLILLLFCDIKKHKYTYLDIDIDATEVLITIRMVCLSCLFINNVFIGMATVIQSFKMDFYLLISLSITNKILCTTTFFISILSNIFLKFSLNEEKIDEQREKYQWLTERVCIWSNIIPMAMFLVVILKDMIFHLKKHSLTFLGHWRDYFLHQARSATTIFTIEMEMGYNTIVTNHNSGNEEYIRLE